MSVSLLPSAASTSSGFSWGGLLVLVGVAVVAWPVWRRAVAALSRQRRERWAREEGWADRTVFTPENDPDLRRDERPTDHPCDPPAGG